MNFDNNNKTPRHSSSSSSSSTSNNSNNNRKKNFKNNNRYKNFNRNNNNSGGGGGNKQYNNRQDHYRNNRSERPIRRPSFEETIKKYESLLADHLQTRKRLYENFYRYDNEAFRPKGNRSRDNFDQQKRKLEEQFYQTLEQLNRFEKELSTEQVKALNIYKNIFPTDKVQTQINSTDDKLNISEAIYSDPHSLNAGSKERPFANDTTESVGTMSDYEHYRSSKVKN